MDEVAQGSLHQIAHPPRKIHNTINDKQPDPADSLINETRLQRAASIAYGGRDNAAIRRVLGFSLSFIRRAKSPVDRCFHRASESHRRLRMKTKRNGRMSGLLADCRGFAWKKLRLSRTVSQGD